MKRTLALAMLLGACTPPHESPPPAPPLARPSAAASAAAPAASSAAPPPAPAASAKPAMIESDTWVPVDDARYGLFEDAPAAPRVGDLAPDFSLPRARGGTFHLADAVAAGPVVLVFYRGYW